MLTALPTSLYDPIQLVWMVKEILGFESRDDVLFTIQASSMGPVFINP